MKFIIRSFFRTLRIVLGPFMRSIISYLQGRFTAA
jgi:hypothetical protein